MVRTPQRIRSGTPLDSTDDSAARADQPPPPAPAHRSIALIGAGLTNIGVLTGLLDLPLEAREGWTIDCWERRRSWGGVWLPDPHPPQPPVEPESAQYDSLELWSLGPNMAFPGRPLPPSTQLFPKAKVVEDYTNDHVKHFGLDKYIHCGHSVENVLLRDGEHQHPWVLTIKDTTQSPPVVRRKRYSTLIVGTGVHPKPRHLELPGEKEWLARHTDRSIIHSMWYRRPEPFKDRFVIVEGRAPSGEIISREVAPVARELHQTYRPGPVNPFPPQTDDNYHTHLGRIVSFGADSAILEDGREIATPSDTSIIRAIGWDRSFPVLGPDIVTPIEGLNFSYEDPTGPLECNSRYIRPLYKTLLAVSPKFPRGSLAFPGQFLILFNLNTGYAQGLWLAHILANMDDGNDLLPSTEKALEEVRAMESEQLAKYGVDMSYKGYFCVPIGTYTDDYADTLIESLRSHSKYALPPRLQSGQYVEPWRRRNFEITMELYAPWQEAKALGIADSFSEGAATEQDFADAVERFKEWSDARKKEESSPKQA